MIDPAQDASEILLLRSERRHDSGDADQRSAFQRDRDRILYSSAFRRLGGVSQVVSVDHIEPFHNRLTHTIKVAQLGRRLAEHLKKQHPELQALDPEVVEAACLAHDLGHPPFGHVGEGVLNEAVTAKGDEEGFEGNAQSFRVLTKLALRSELTPGLNLTRAVLSASIKYPWPHSDAMRRNSRKFGFYKTEREDFVFAVNASQPADRALEAVIMDYADDIAYSVHDIEDFHRIRAIPWQLLQIGRRLPPEKQEKVNELIEAAAVDWYGAPSDARKRLKRAAEQIIKRTSQYSPLFEEPYDGTRDQRVSVRNWTSELIKRYVLDLSPSIQLSGGTYILALNEEAEAEIRFLKQIIRSFVIQCQPIGAQQLGQKRIVESVYEDIFNDIQAFRSTGKGLRITPLRFHYLARDSQETATTARLAADCIASLTENELGAIYRRLRGFSGGSVVDPIVR
jgi:dGTPase